MINIDRSRPIEVKDHAPDPGLSQHEMDVILGKASQTVPTAANPVEYGAFVLGTTKVKKVAVILEIRPLSHLLPLFLHFSLVLSPEWPVCLFTTPSIVKVLEKSSTFNQALNDGRIELRGLPMGVPTDYPFHDPLKQAEFQPSPYLLISLKTV